MTRPAGTRPRPPSSRSGAFFIFGLALLSLPPSPAAGQVPDTVRPATPEPPPVPRDTTPTEAPPQDTVPADTIPPAALVRIGPVGPAGWSRGVWEWDRAALVRLPDLSLLQLLERIPGITPVRSAHAGQAEGVAVFASAAGAVRYLVDGFELDPMVAPTFDPTRIPLLALASVRIERGVTGATVHIETMAPGDPRTLTAVEAGTGDFDTNLFRGIFLAPRVLGGSLGLGFERMAADRIAGGDATHTALWLRWAVARDSAGMQVEYRQSEMVRTGVGAGLISDRHDWTVRARGRLAGLAAEAYVGAAATDDERGTLRLRAGSPHAGARLRAAFELPIPNETRATLRFRDDPSLARQELEIESWLRPVPWIGIGANAIERGGGVAGRAGGAAAAHLRLGPLLGLSAFADVERGRGLLGGGPDVVVRGGDGEEAFAIERDGLRAGLAFERWGAHLGIARLRSTADSAAAFGLEFDSTAVRVEAGTAEGFEAVVGLPTGWSPLRLEGWWVGMDAPGAWLYLPDHRWALGLTYHHRPLPSGNLEIYSRLEHAYRGRMSVAAADQAVSVGPYRATDFELSIRVLTVTAFLRWDNVFNRRLQRDLPDSPLPGQHVLYGVKWMFWN